MLLKVFVGVPFYSKRNLGSLRSYLIARYAYNVFIVCPALAVLNYLTRTYVLNFFITGGILIFLESILGLFYVRHLYRRQSSELFEDIPGFKIVQNSSGNGKLSARGGDQSSAMVLQMNVREAAYYLRKKMGERRSEQIVKEME